MNEAPGFHLQQPVIPKLRLRGWRPASLKYIVSSKLAWVRETCLQKQAWFFVNTVRMTPACSHRILWSACDWDLSKIQIRIWCSFVRPSNNICQPSTCLQKELFMEITLPFSTSSRENFPFLSSSRQCGMDPSWSPNPRKLWPDTREVAFLESPLANQQKQVANRN